MSHHHHDEKPKRSEQKQPQRPNPERPDPEGNPAEHTGPRGNPEPDRDRLEKAREDQERTIAS